MINYKDTLPEALYTRFDNNSAEVQGIHKL